MDGETDLSVEKAKADFITEMESEKVRFEAKKAQYVAARHSSISDWTEKKEQLEFKFAANKAAYEDCKLQAETKIANLSLERNLAEFDSLKKTNGLEYKLSVAKAEHENDRAQKAALREQWSAKKEYMEAERAQWMAKKEEIAYKRENLLFQKSMFDSVRDLKKMGVREEAIVIALPEVNNLMGNGLVCELFAEGAPFAETGASNKSSTKNGDCIVTSAKKSPASKFLTKCSKPSSDKQYLGYDNDEGQEYVNLVSKNHEFYNDSKRKRQFDEKKDGDYGGTGSEPDRKLRKPADKGC